jgi:purine-binding chemotaxis protein CheW
MAEEAHRASTLVAFDIGTVGYAIAIDTVREIIRPLAVEALRSTELGVVGVFDHRGEVVPLIDLRVRLHAEVSEPTRETRWIVVQRGESLIGLIVDRVHEVFSAQPQDARSVPDLGRVGAAGTVRAAYSQRGRLVFVLDSALLTELAGSLPELASRRLIRPERP